MNGWKDQADVIFREAGEQTPVTGEGEGAFPTHLVFLLSDAPADGRQQRPTTPATG